MSIYCPNCQKLTYDENICDMCGYEIKKEKTYDFKHPKKNKLSSYKVNNKKNLIKQCSVCGENISENAISCPNCGDIKSKYIAWKIVKYSFIIIISLIVAEFIIAKIKISYFNNFLKSFEKELTTLYDIEIPQPNNINTFKVDKEKEKK